MPKKSSEDPSTSGRVNYSLHLPFAMFEEIRAAAAAECTSIRDFIVTWIKRGLFLYNHIRNGGEVFIENKEKKYRVIF